MKYFNIFLLLFLVWIQISCNKDDFDQEPGIVITGKIINSETGAPISNIVISDGYSTTLSSKDGTYQFKGKLDARHVFYSIPEEYKITRSNGTPDFYSEIETVNDTCFADFELTLNDEGIETEFTLLCVTDVHVNSDKSLNRFLNETVPDMTREMNNHENIYGINLGDLVSDKTEYFSEIKATFSSFTIPFFHVIGNHDFVPEESESVKAAIEYEKHFGPINYSFNRGEIHIIVMNSVLYRGDCTHDRGFTEDDIGWLKDNLKYVDNNKTLLVFTHIPPRYDLFSFRDEFFSAMKDFNEVRVFGGHSHSNNYFIHEAYNIYEHTLSNASGNSWIAGVINKSGVPNGYSIIKIKGTSLTDSYFKPVNYTKEFQIRMYEPFSFGDNEGYVVANVWNHDFRWTVKLYENDVLTGEMEQFADYDPGTFAYIYSIGRSLKETPAWFRKTPKLFRLKPISSNSEIKVVATDSYGNTFIQDSFVKSLEEFDSYSD